MGKVVGVLAEPRPEYGDKFFWRGKVRNNMLPSFSRVCSTVLLLWEMCLHVRKRRFQRGGGEGWVDVISKPITSLITRLRKTRNSPTVRGKGRCKRERGGERREFKRVTMPKPPIILHFHRAARGGVAS